MVYGKDLLGNSVGFSSPGMILPAWEENPAEISELRFLELPASEVFAPEIKILTTFLNLARENHTGIMIKEIF